MPEHETKKAAAQDDQQREAGKFSFQMVYDKKDFAALVRALSLRRRSLRAMDRVSRVCFLLSGGLLILVGGVGLAMNLAGLFRGTGLRPLSLATDLFFLLLGSVVCLRTTGRLAAWMSWRQYQDKGKGVVYDFYEDRFEEHAEHSDYRFDYDIILDVLEDRGHFFLLVNASTAHVLRKADMAGGQPQAFAGFLAERCGKKPVQIG